MPDTLTASMPLVAADMFGGSAVLPVELRDVVFEAGGKRLIDGLSLRLERGTRTVVMGPNGAGKSLTLRLLQGLLTPSRGVIAWGGNAEARPADRKVAMVFQKPVLLRRSVAGNLLHAIRVCGHRSSERASRLDRLLEDGALTHLKNAPARLLSGGEQQRLALVRALAGEPELLLLDEPTASLDPQSTHAIEVLIERVRMKGTKVVLVTHDVGQARRLADDIVFLHRGRLAEQATASDFFDNPQSKPAQAYLDGRLVL